MAEDREDPTRDDLALKALFGEASRPPMGDEDFVSGVMARVEAQEVNRASRWQAFGIAAAGAVVAVGVANYGTVMGALADAFAGYAAQVPALAGLDGGGMALAALAAAAAGYGYAQR